jgi:prepilin-type N-terminal cleavage/methylation domain-containing protein
MWSRICKRVHGMKTGCPNKTASTTPEHSAGFSLIELLIVIALIAGMVAIALPSAIAYVRVYKIRVAARDLAGELQAARNQAIVRNSTRGVSLYAVDKNSYRIIDEDLMRQPGRVAASEFGPLRDLPYGIEFVGGGNAGVQFQRMGQSCVLGLGGCAALVTGAQCTAAESSGRCGDSPGNYATWNAGRQLVRFTLRQIRDSRQLNIDVTSGGRVEVEQ